MVIHDLHDLGYPHNLGNLRLMAAFLWSNIDVENQLFVHDVPSGSYGVATSMYRG